MQDRERTDQNLPTHVEDSRWMTIPMLRKKEKQVRGWKRRKNNFLQNSIYTELFAKYKTTQVDNSDWSEEQSEEKIQERKKIGPRFLFSSVISQPLQDMDPQPASHTPTHFTHLQTPDFIAAMQWTKQPPPHHAMKSRRCRRLSNCSWLLCWCKSNNSSGNLVLLKCFIDFHGCSCEL